MNDPLDAVFVTGDESAELKRVDTARKLATYLERMPAKLRRLFGEQFQRISSAELAQLRDDSLLLIGSNRLLSEIGALLNCAPDATILDGISALRADLQDAQVSIAELENDIVCAFCGAHYSASDAPPQHYLTCKSSPLVRSIAEARYCIMRRLRFHENYPPISSARWADRENGIPGKDARDCDCDYCIEDRAWLAANPAPEAEPQP